MSLDPYGDAAPTPTTFWRPRESERSIYTEKKLGDETLALWETIDLPADAAVTHVTLIPYRREKAVLRWQKGQVSLPEGDVAPGESVDTAIKRIAAEQAGIANATWAHLGHFRCRATAASKKLPSGSVTYDALFGLEVEALADFPSDGAYERRIILQRDLNTLLRSSYVERRREFTDSLDGWLLQRLKANLREG